MRLYLDSNALIFAHEGPVDLQRTVIEQIVKVCLLPGGTVTTSLLARLEFRVRPLREQDQPLLDHYDFVFGRSGLQVIPITAEIIERATDLRASHLFRTPDAIHLATALCIGADVFLTGDKALARCPGLNFEIL